jgi:hypothetical protein
VMSCMNEADYTRPVGAFSHGSDVYVSILSYKCQSCSTGGSISQIMCCKLLPVFLTAWYS